MSTPYEEISETYSSREAVKTDANLAQDSQQLGGLDAEDYATKEYVKKALSNNSKQDKEYTDSQIKQITETLKGYTDNVVGNIDFTPYAKKTDLEAVKENLEEHCKNSCANTLTQAKAYTDNVKNEINVQITNINTGIDGVNEDIEELQGKYEELFQSVSSGKELVAEAITDKGVPTSATDSFNTMAGNVRKISTGTDTSDATATANEILHNYTAYAKGQKLIGNYVPPYLPPSYPTTGTDTSDATANASDIRYGKVAYANGQRLVGTLQPNTTTRPDGTIVTTDLKEMYHLIGEGYEKSTVGSFTSIFEEGSETVAKTLCLDIMWENNTAENGAYIVRHIQEGIGEFLKSNKYIYSNKIYNGSIVKQVTASGTGEYIERKYRYSYEELGIEGEVKKIILGTPGYMNNPQLCLLVIIEKNSNNEWIAHFYPYHLSGEGIIGNSYEGEFNYPHRALNLEPGFEDVSYDNFVAAKLSANTFAYHYLRAEDNSHSDLKILHIYDDTKYIDENAKVFLEETRFSNIAFEASDTILNCNPHKYGKGTYCFIETDEYNHYQVVATQTKDFVKTNISDDGRYMYVYEQAEGGHEGSDKGICNANIDYINHTISYTTIKEQIIYDWRNANNDRTGNIYEALGNDNNAKITFSKDNKYIFVKTWDVTNRIYEFELSIDGENTQIVSGFKYDAGKDNPTKKFYIEPNNANEYFVWNSNSLARGKQNISSEILAIEYKGQIFYSVKALQNVEEG